MLAGRERLALGVFSVALEKGKACRIRTCEAEFTCCVTLGRRADAFVARSFWGCPCSCTRPWHNHPRETHIGLVNSWAGRVHAEVDTRMVTRKIPGALQ